MSQRLFASLRSVTGEYRWRRIRFRTLATIGSSVGGRRRRRSRWAVGRADAKLWQFQLKRREERRSDGARRLLFKFIRVDTTVPRHLRHVDRIELIRRNPHLFRHPPQKKKIQNKSNNFQTRFFCLFLPVSYYYNLPWCNIWCRRSGGRVCNCATTSQKRRSESFDTRSKPFFFVFFVFFFRFSIEKITKIEIT